MQLVPPIPRRSLALWKKLVFAGVVFLAFFAAIEGMLALWGVSAGLGDEDPFVGFAGNAPLFERRTNAEGECVMETSRRKLAWFNDQQFPCAKAARTRRIFSLGESTTYGHPYDDRTSFTGWLREFLRAADHEHDWEVINAGGISYASYRIARIAEEVLQYDPDLLIIYVGHNEFLERRTYGHLLGTPQVVRDSGELLGRLRTTALLRHMLNGRRTASAPRPELPDEVMPILEQTVGPTSYHRDDEWRRGVIAHYRFNLQRMVALAQDRGVGVILVTPAANLRDFAPFKSEHRGGTQTELARADMDLHAANLASERGELETALAAVDRSLAIDDRFADAHYLRGRILEQSGRHREARKAFVRALVEDVCPLRALPEIIQAVRDVGRERNVPVVDFVAWLDRGNSAPGSEWFLDHVHPTIEGYRQLALQLLETMRRQRWLPEDAELTTVQIDQVATRVRAGIDQRDHAVALKNLSKVLGWAGKTEEADRLALRAVGLLGDDAEAHYQAGAALYRQGDLEGALAEFQQSLNIDTQHPRAHYGVGLIYAETGRPEEAIREYKRSLEIYPDASATHFNLARMYEEVEDPASAVLHYREALRINPDDFEAYNNLALVLARQGKLNEARPLFEKALQIKPDFVDALSNLGQLFLLQGDRRQSAKYVRQALEVAPDHPQARQIWKELNRAH